MSDSLIPSFLWAMWANRSGRSLKMSNVSESIRSLTKNEQIVCFFERIAQVAQFFAKKGVSLRKPLSEFPALPLAHICQHAVYIPGFWINPNLRGQGLKRALTFSGDTIKIKYEKNWEQFYIPC